MAHFRSRMEICFEILQQLKAERNELSTHLNLKVGINHQVTNALLARLQQQGLITVAPGKHNLYNLTPKGNAALNVYTCLCDLVGLPNINSMPMKFKYELLEEES